MQKNVNKAIWISRIGLGLIFCYCLLASVLFSYFAQIHLSLGFLPFPVFVGEIVMFICLPLLAWACKGGKLFNQRTTLLLGLYFGWVVGKALINYFYEGPLTCRNAALFYYPIFAVFAYCFYQRARIPRKVLMLLAFWATGIMLFKVMVLWYWWTYVSLFVIAVWNTKSIKLRWLGWIFLAAIFLLGKEYLYKGPRAHFVGVFCAVLFLASYFGALLAKRHDYVRLGVLLASLVFFISGFFIFSDRNAVTSVTSLKGIIETYQTFDRELERKKITYVPEKLSVQLYHPKEYQSPFLPSSILASQPAVEHPTTLQGTRFKSVASPASKNAGGGPLSDGLKNNPINNIFQPLKGGLKDIRRCRIREGRSLDLDENNIVFRLFVWRDMARELVEQKAWWGFSFGHPQRSRSLEALHWAESEWERDGWITPHNSFFHIIYRAGILGVFLIMILFFLIGKLVRDFFIMNSVEGGFLVGALVYWLALSNFFVILEFPYNAIIFWTLFGITWAYRDGLKFKK